MKRNDEINHGMIDKLAYKGQDHSNVPSLLELVNDRIRHDRSFCAYCTALDWNYRGRGIPLENETHFNNSDNPYIHVILGNEYNLQKSRWLLSTWDGNHPIHYCPMCGRKLDENSEITMVPELDYRKEEWK